MPPLFFRAKSRNNFFICFFFFLLYFCVVATARNLKRASFDGMGGGGYVFMIIIINFFLVYYDLPSKNCPTGKLRTSVVHNYNNQNRNQRRTPFESRAGAAEKNNGILSRRLVRLTFVGGGRV